MPIQNERDMRGTSPTASDAERMTGGGSKAATDSSKSDKQSGDARKFAGAGPALDKHSKDTKPSKR
jgi:hypothetical protein